MIDSISNIAKEIVSLNTKIFNSTKLGLRNGLTGISLFNFYYTRLTGDNTYVALTNMNLEKVITHACFFISYFYAPEFSDIGKTVFLLKKEKFMDISSEQLDKYFDEPLMKRLRDDLGMEFGFCEGTTGICDYFLDKPNSMEALELILGNLYRGLHVWGYPSHFMEPRFLFTTEILRDIRLFFLKLDKMNISYPKKNRLIRAIRKMESKKFPSSDNPEYPVLQDLREAVILENSQKIKSTLENIAANSSNLIFKGLATLSLEDSRLSAWCGLV